MELTMKTSVERKPKPYKGIGMEGMIATWYARNTGKSIAEYHNLAKRIADGLRPATGVLEVAPDRLSRHRAGAAWFLSRAGLDVSRTFVRIGREKCRARLR